MHPGVAFILYLAVGCILILTFLLICVRVSVFIEDTCPTRFCLKRKQRKVRKTLIRRMLYPDEPESPRPAPPSDENITSDIICQPYIYRDAYSTGLTGLSMLANLPLSIGYIQEGNPSDAVVTSGDQLQLRQNRRILPLRAFQNQFHQRITSGGNAGHATANSVGEINLERESAMDGDESLAVAVEVEEEVASLPPDYSNVACSESVKLDNLDKEEDEQPPPSYYECVINSRRAEGLNSNDEFV